MECVSVKEYLFGMMVVRRVIFFDPLDLESQPNGKRDQKREYPTYLHKFYLNIYLIIHKTNIQLLGWQLKFNLAMKEYLPSPGSANIFL
jgi:hypothetical protein